MDEICRKVNLLVVLVPGLKRNLFSYCVAVADKGVESITFKQGSFLDLGTFSVLLTRSENRNHLHVNITTESKRTETALKALSGQVLGDEVATDNFSLASKTSSIGSTAGCMCQRMARTYSS